MVSNLSQKLEDNMKVQEEMQQTIAKVQEQQISYDQRLSKVEDTMGEVLNVMGDSKATTNSVELMFEMESMLEKAEAGKIAHQSVIYPATGENRSAEEIVKAELAPEEGSIVSIKRLIEGKSGMLVTWADAQVAKAMHGKHKAMTEAKSTRMFMRRSNTHIID